MHCLALGQNRQPVGDGMRQRQATALKANTREQNIALDQALNCRRCTALFEIARGSDAALHECVIAGTSRNQGQVPRRATVLVGTVRRGARTRLEVRCQCVAHASDRHTQWGCRDHVGIDHDQVWILLEHQVAVERPILVIQHRNRAARTVHRSRRGAYAQRQLGIKRNGLGDIEHLAAANTHHHVAILSLGFLSHFDNGLFRTRTVINLKERLTQIVVQKSIDDLPAQPILGALVKQDIGSAAQP